MYSPSRSNIVGIEGPYISASRTPTLHPILVNITAIFAVTVDFPNTPSRRYGNDI